jgi:phosphoribosylformylglycinamidine (FGAM) synthase-like enzyme
MRGGLVHACHDLSEGGLAVAAAEMAFAGRLGLDLVLERMPRADGVDEDDVALFSESSARFLVEVTPENAAAFEKAMCERPVARIGHVIDDGVLRVQGLQGRVVIESSVEHLLEAWQGTEVA